MRTKYKYFLPKSIMGIFLLVGCINRKDATYRYYFSTDYCAVIHPYSKDKKNQNNSRKRIIEISASEHIVKSNDQFVPGIVRQEFYIVSDTDTVKLSDKEIQDSCSFRFSYMKDHVIEYIVYGKKNTKDLNEINRFFAGVADSLYKNR